MLVNHADAGGDSGPRLARRKKLSECFDRSSIGHIVAEEDIHQRCLAGAVLAQKGNDFTATQFDAYGIVGEQRAKTFGDSAEPKYGLRLSRFGFGPSSTSALRR